MSSNYGLFMSIKNCTFSFNSAQLGGAICMVANAQSPFFVNITNSVFLSNNASKEKTYLGLDLSQGGVITAINSQSTFLYISDSFILSSYSKKGIFFSFF